MKAKDPRNSILQMAVGARVHMQDILFALAGGGCLMLDKGAWFSEMIIIGMGDSWEGLVYDDSQNWEDDPEEHEVHYDWSRYFAVVLLTRSSLLDCADGWQNANLPRHTDTIASKARQG
ncbi:MAG: hypothetical protein Q4A07_12290 [Coriobacteriales bacterium]|nr:hypothetical protein [Coriobacteriales bacterium]